MKKASIFVVLSVLMVFLGVAMWTTVSGGRRYLDLPRFPVMVSEPGKYWIDASRYVRVTVDSGKITYREGEEGKPTSKYWGAIETAVATERRLASVRLVEGWVIGLEGGDTIVIRLGDGSTIRREFGEAVIDVSELRKDTADSIRKRIAELEGSEQHAEKDFLKVMRHLLEDLEEEGGVVGEQPEQQ